MAVLKRWQTTRSGFAEQQIRTAPHDGVYLLNGVPFRVFAGDPLPQGAVMREERARQAAPETEAKGRAPETKARGKKAD